MKPTTLALAARVLHLRAIAEQAALAEARQIHARRLAAAEADAARIARELAIDAPANLASIMAATLWLPGAQAQLVASRAAVAGDEAACRGHEEALAAARRLEKGLDQLAAIQRKDTQQRATRRDMSLDLLALGPRMRPGI